jgi:hypothetical protein
MDNQKAKLRLSVYRQTGADAQDPFFSEALQQAEKDPALRAWLADQQAFDAQFSAALASVSAPQEGRALIEATMMRKPSSWTRWWRPLALAASIAVLITLSTSWWRDRTLTLPQEASVAELARTLSDHHVSIGLMSPDYSKLRAWLTEKESPMPGTLPPGLAQYGLIGCQTWKTTRGKVSLICFMDGNKGIYHLYVFEAPHDRQSAPGGSEPQIQREGDWSFALWQDGGRTHALGARGDARMEESLRALFRA